MPFRCEAGRSVLCLLSADDLAHKRRVKRIVGIAGVSLFVTMVSCLADGGVIVARQTINGLDVTVFASPVPLQAGPVDVSVLVQAADTGETALDAAVNVSWSPTSSASPDWLPPCCSMTTNSDKISATRGHSQNKFLYSAIVPVSSSGPSELVIRATRGGREALLSCDIVVAPPRGPALAYWPFLALPPFAVVGFALHQRLSRRSGA